MQNNKLHSQNEVKNIFSSEEIFGFRIRYSESLFKALDKEAKFWIRNSVLNHVGILNHKLFVVRPHRIFLRNYACMKSKYKHFFIIQTYELAKEFINVFRELFLATIAPRNRLWHRVGKEDVLIVSHFQKIDEAQDFVDFYFEDLAKVLRSRELIVGLVLINHTGKRLDAPVKKNLESPFSSITLLNEFNSFSKELRYIWESLLYILKNFLRVVSLEESERRAIALNLIFGAFSRATFKNLRIFDQIRTICAERQPQIVITTFEGNSFERSVFKAVKSLAKMNQTICIGFHHSAYFLGQSMLLTPITRQTDPDLVLTSGEFAADILRSLWSPVGVKIILFGGPRAFQTATSNNKDIDFLILPEADFEECVILLAFVSLLVDKYPGKRFHFKPHPSGDISKSLGYFPELSSRSNFTVDTSVNSLDVFGRAWCSIYRGSTSIINAVRAGSLALYVDTGFPNIDPLWSIDNTECLKIRSYSDFDEFMSKPNIASSGDSFRTQTEVLKIIGDRDIGPFGEFLHSIMNFSEFSSKAHSVVRCQ
jgi:hypothetical protein